MRSRESGLLRPAVSRALFGYFSRYRGRALTALLAMAVVSLATVLLLFLFNKVIDDTLGAGTAASLTGRQGLRLRPRGAAAALARERVRARHGGRRRGRNPDPLRRAAAALRGAPGQERSVLFSEYELNGIGLGMVRDLRSDACERLIRQSSRFYARASTGDLMSRLLTDVEQIQLAFGSRLADFAQGALTIVFVLAYVFSLNARLSFVVFVVTPVILVSIVENARRLRRTAISSRERIGEMGTRLSERSEGKPRHQDLRNGELRGASACARPTTGTSA